MADTFKYSFSKQISFPLMLITACFASIMMLCSCSAGQPSDRSTDSSISQDSSNELRETAPSNNNVDEYSAQEDEDAPTPNHQEDTQTDNPSILGYDVIPISSFSTWANGDSPDQRPEGWLLRDYSLFVSHEDMVYPLASSLAQPASDDAHVEIWDERAAYIIQSSKPWESGSSFNEPADYDVIAFPICVQDGDSILTTQPLYDDAYLVPLESAPKTYSCGGYVNWLWYDEVEGVALDDLSGQDKQDAIDSALASSGVYLADVSRLDYMADAPKVISVGEWAGTIFEESLIYLDTPIAFKPEGVMGSVCTISKTKDGYFVIELGDPEPGEYMLVVPQGEFTKYRLIEIR